MSRYETWDVLTLPRAEMPFRQDDGGRSQAGFRGQTGDCVVRAIAIATGEPYRTVYDELFALTRTARLDPRRRITGSASPRFGVPKSVFGPYLAERGWAWTPTMAVGSGCRVHLTPGELPQGRLIVQVSKHVLALIDGVIHDTYDPSRGGSRCVYGYWQEAS